MMNRHTFSNYVLQDDIGLVIAKGLSVVYKEKPPNPVNWFANWLLLENQKRKDEAEGRRAQEMVEKMKDKEAYLLMQLDRELDDKRALEMENQVKIT